LGSEFRGLPSIQFWGGFCYARSIGTLKTLLEKKMTQKKKSMGETTGQDILMCLEEGCKEKKC